MTTTNHLVYGWEIEGFGTYYDYDYGSGGVRISTETLEGVTANTMLYYKGLADLPRKISTTCEPLKGSTTQSTMQILIDRFDLPDVDGRRYGAEALRFFWGARPKSVARIQTSISAAATSITVDIIAGETVPAAGDTAYIGREAWAVINVSGSGATRTLTVERGALSTTATTHDLEDPDIYLQNPVKLDRKVTLYEYDVRTDTEAARWRGVVESIDLTDDTQVLCITCRDLLGTLSKRRIAKERWEGQVNIWRPNNQQGERGQSVFITRLSSESAKVVDHLPFYPFFDAGVLHGTDQYTTLGFFVSAITLEIDGHAVATQCIPPDFPASGFAAKYYHFTEMGGPCKEVDGLEIDVENKAESKRACEILVCDADSPFCYFKDADAEPSDHPAVILLNLLTSDGTATWTGGGGHVAGTGEYNWLPGAWGLGIPAAWVDDTSFYLPSVRFPTSTLRARSGYIGGGGDNGSALDLLADLAQSMNCYIYMDDQARLACRRLADPGAGNTDHTLDASNIAWASNEGDDQGMSDQKPIYAISLECCQRGPGGEPAQIIDAGITGQKWVSRYRFHAVRDKLESTRIYGDPVSHNLSTAEIANIANVFAWRYAWSIDKLPEYRIRLVHGSDLVMPGQWVTLSHPYLFDNESLTRGITNHRCLVVEGNWDIETGAQEIVVVDAQPITGASTLVSPAWQVTAFTSSTSFTLSDTWFEGGGERNNFVAGATYKIDLWTADGQLRSTDGPSYASAFNAGSGVVTLNAAWTASAVAVTPAVGDVVRLATYDNSVGWQGLDYTWLGDASMQLGANNDPAGRWDV